MCTISLPPSINPMPDNLFNPFAQPIPPDPDIPVFPSPPTVPPPSNPLQPYNAPMTVPQCPFQDACGKRAGFDCVGFDSWGFSSVKMAHYSPASRFFNSITCSYIMKPYDRFKVPEKVTALWKLQEKRGLVVGHYNTDLTLICKDQNFTNTWGKMCNEQVFRLKIDCGVPWSGLWQGSCSKAPPPAGFNATSSLGEFCPRECGYKEHELVWPYE